MVDVIVGNVAARLTLMLLDNIVQDATLVAHFTQNLEKLTDEIKYMTAFVSDANRRSRQEMTLKLWLHDLQALVYDAEDLFEECEDLPVGRPGCLCISPAQLLFRNRMGKRVSQPIVRIDEIRKLSEKYNLASLAYSNPCPAPANTEASLKRTMMLRDESNTVGMQQSIHHISSWLLNDHHQKQCIAVVGIGGGGKTLLLHHVFQKIRQNVQNFAWVTISQNYSVKDLQERMGRELSLYNLQDLSDEEAKKVIFSHLSGKKSLLVLDDVWRGKRVELFEQLGLPDENNCKIIISTRDRHVAEDLGAEIYLMPDLSEENWWKLLCLYAFPESDGAPPEELEDVAHRIAKRCANLPLAIKTVAASLATKSRLPNVWNGVVNDMPELSDSVMPILQISYDALSSNLKLCFLYCSLFAEDTDISCEYLMNLWIGEGFVSSQGMKQPSDVAQDYIDELFSRCLIEPSLVWDGRILKCKMHDLFRDLAVSKSEDVMNCFFQDGKKQLKEFTSQHRHSPCRVSVINGSLRVIPKNWERLVSLRTLLIANNPYDVNVNVEHDVHVDVEHITSEFFIHLKRLRLLDLCNSPISLLPKSLGNCKHLRVLNLSGSKIEELPESICHLHRLQYLDISLCNNLKKLPLGIGQLKCLTYLNLSGSDTDFMPRGISSLVSLEILRPPSEYDLLGGNDFRFEHLKGLTKLRQLQMWMRADGQIQMEEGVFSSLHKMRRLLLYNIGEQTVHLPNDMEGMTELEQLQLSRFFAPDFLAKFQNLLTLELSDFKCTEYPRLDKLTNLRHLTLHYDQNCSQLPEEFGRSKGFPQLQYLTIDGFSNLEEMPKLKSGAMPMIQSLEVWDSPKLKKMADGLEHLKSLEKLIVGRCNGWRERLKNGGEDFVKLKANIPHLQIELHPEVDLEFDFDWGDDVDYGKEFDSEAEVDTQG